MPSAALSSSLSGAPSRFSSPLLDYQVQESISWFRGKHAIKTGIEGLLKHYVPEVETVEAV